MNNANKLLWWILGFLATLVIAGSGMWIKSISNEIARTSQAQQERGERVTQVESTVRSLEARLERIENKLDKISERLEKR